MLQTVKQGAAVVRRISKKNPMEVLVSVIDGDPSANRDRLFRQWWLIVQEDEDLLNAVVQQTFANLLNRVDFDRRQSAPRKAVAQVAQVSRDERAKLIGKVSGQVAGIILMNMTLPSGKLLRDATFKECSLAGGFYAAVAKKGKPAQIVGKVLSEERLRAILGK